jgi:hypothetical protein
VETCRHEAATYDIHSAIMSAPKVLIILSDAHAFEVKKKDGTVAEEETGFFLMELAKPLAKLIDAGYQVTVC